MRHILFPILIASVLIAFPVPLRASTEIIIIKSSDIIPYQKAVEGFKKSFPDGAYREYTIEEDVEEKGKAILKGAVERGGALIVAVGPQAAYLTGTNSASIPMIFTMVPDPENLWTGGNKTYPGVRFILPVAFQLEQIKATFPGRKKIGVLYTPEHNQKRIDSMVAQGIALGLTVLGKPIRSQKDIPQVLKSELLDMDVLLIIPDRTIDSEKIAKYLIKSMLIKKIPVVGFNKWLAENGAILSFALDYEEIGKQTAEFAQVILREKRPPENMVQVQEPFKIRTIINLKVAQKLSVELSEEMLKSANEVIK